MRFCVYLLYSNYITDFEGLTKKKKCSIIYVFSKYSWIISLHNNLTNVQTGTAFLGICIPTGHSRVQNCYLLREKKYHMLNPRRTNPFFRELEAQLSKVTNKAATSLNQAFNWIFFESTSLCNMWYLRFCLEWRLPWKIL